MKTPIPFFAGLWLVWTGVCAFLMWQFCENCGVLSNSLLISYGETTIVNAPSDIHFAFGAVAAVIPDETQKELGKLVDYLEKHPATVLQVAGGWLEAEKSESEGTSMGLARASSFRDQLIEMGIPARQLTIGEQLTAEKLRTDDEIVWKAFEYQFSEHPLEINDSDQLNIITNDNLVFGFSDYAPSASSAVMESLERTANYLQEHPDRILHLIGMYSEQEENSSIYNDLGLARANAVKNILFDFDVPTSQIIIAGAMNPELDAFDKGILGGVLFNFTERKQNEQSLQELKNTLEQLKTEIYIDEVNNQLQITNEIRQYFTAISYYLTYQPNGEIVVVTYSEKAKSKREASRKRAEFVRDYLTEHGIALLGQIEIDTKDMPRDKRKDEAFGLQVALEVQ